MDDLAVFGVDAESARAWAKPDEGKECDFEIWPDNFTALQAFLALATQWRLVSVGMAGVIYQGIEYSVVPTVLRLKAIARAEWPEMFEALRVMESAALPVLNAKQKSKP